MNAKRDENGEPDAEAAHEAGHRGSLVIYEDSTPAGTVITIKHADPRICIEKNHFREALAGDRLLPGVTFTPEKITVTDSAGRKVIYVITGYNPVEGCFEAEWPD